mgnify:CR=1 FL=1
MKTSVRKPVTAKLAIIQTTLKAPKNRTNSFGKYKYRSAEDILEALKPLLKEQNVSLVINEELISGDNGAFPIIKSIATLVDNHDGKTSISAIALVGVDLNSKGMQMPQKFGAASSYGKKYALGNLFLLDDTQDSDATNTHGKPAAKAVKKTELTKSHPQFQKTIEWLAKGDTNGDKMKKLLDNYIVKAALVAELTELSKNNNAVTL